MPDDQRGLTPRDDDSKPEVVVEAEQTVRRLGLTLVGAGAAVSLAYWVQALVMGFPFFPMSWWALFLVGLVLIFLYPQNRTARQARDVLRRWDEIETRNALEISGAPTDPRLQVAETMCARILQHPGVTPRTTQVVASLLNRLRQGTRDQRILEVMREADGHWPSTIPGPRSLSDVADYVEVRIGRLLGTLAEVHAAVVKRDDEGVAEVLDNANEVLVELEASLEVDRLLRDGAE